MDFALIWTEKALSDLEEAIRFYREDQRSLDAARRVGTEIIEPLKFLSRFPILGRSIRKKPEYTVKFCVSSSGSFIESIEMLALYILLAFGMSGRI